MSKLSKPRRPGVAKAVESGEIERGRGALSQRDTEKCRAVLLEQKSELLRRIEGHERPVRGEVEPLPDEMDMASHEAEQGTLLRILDKERKLLSELEHALSKFEHGTYGLCEGTGELIELRRLLARPWARYSLAFKEALETEERGFAR